MKRSSRVPLGIIGLASGAAVLMGIHHWSTRGREDDALVSETFTVDNFPGKGIDLITSNGELVKAPQLSEKQELENDSYTPSVGYYHAPANLWFPYPWNYHVPERGYFQSGNWVSKPTQPSVVRSIPNYYAVQHARGLWMDTYGVRDGRGWSFGTSAHDPHTGHVSNLPHNRPRPSSTVSRGGFGSSGRGNTFGS